MAQHGRDDPRVQQWARRMGVVLDDKPPEARTSAVSDSRTGRPPNSFFSRPQWNSRTGRWERETDWGNVASLAVGALIGAPHIAALAGGGAGAGAGAGTLASVEGATGAPTFFGSLTPALAAENAAMAAGAAGATGAAVAPGAVSLGGGTAATTGSRILDWFKDPKNVAGVGSIVAGLTAGRGNGQSAEDTEEARRMRQITEARMRRVDPLHQAVTQLAWGRLPVSARQGLSLTQIPLPNSPGFPAAGADLGPAVPVNTGGRGKEKPR